MATCVTLAGEARLLDKKRFPPVAKVCHERAAKGGAEVERWRSGDRNNLNRRYVSTMSAIGDRWAAEGNNRLANFWRVVLHISDAMYAGASE
jgi:hypothetical protein